jgi:hypothetical protein
MMVPISALPCLRRPTDSRFALTHLCVSSRAAVQRAVVLQHHRQAVHAVTQGGRRVAGVGALRQVRVHLHSGSSEGVNRRVCQ